MDYCTNRDEKCDRMKYAETYQYMNERGGSRCSMPRTDELDNGWEGVDLCNNGHTLVLMQVSDA
jgi:hypothetical protein